jgi:hypothetical protein
MYGTTVKVTAVVTVETEYGYDRKNSSASTMHPEQLDDAELVDDDSNEVVDDVHVQFAAEKYQ